MHVPDGLVPLWLQILMLVVAGVFVGAAARVVNRRFDDRLVPYMGVLAAVIFAAQFVNFPVPPASSGHLIGATLVAVLLGPWAAMLIIALVLFVQALYGDGGILTYGLNFFNMGVVATFVGWAISLVLFKALCRVTSSKKAILLGTAVGAYVSTVVAAMVLGVELFTVTGFGMEAFTAITVVHLLIAFGEALLTSIVLLYFVKANPRLISFFSDSDTGELAHVPVIEASPAATIENRRSSS